jgi:riboflavin synthase
MFTGIITHQGMVVAREALPAGLRLEIACGLDLSQVPLGASIACDGVCLTVISTTDKSFTAEVSEETLSKTTLGSWQIGYQMNLERAIQAGGDFRVRSGCWKSVFLLRCAAILLRKDPSPLTEFP